MKELKKLNLICEKPNSQHRFTFLSDSTTIDNKILIFMT
jgi:hypothetical protein